MPVVYPEGIVHGFLTLSTLEGARLAEGDVIQTARGGRVKSRLLLKFRDGSVHDETVVFSQKDQFRILRYHLSQKGPAFPRPMDVAADSDSGEVRVRYTDDGKEKTVSERQELPADLSNGMVLVLLKNIRPEAARTTVSMLATTPKPRLVKLVISPAGDEPFDVGGSRRSARRYVVKVDLGGVAGIVAPLIGKQPPDSHVWMLGGDAPAFVRSEMPLYDGGPLWRLELASPTWPEPTAAKR